MLKDYKQIYAEVANAIEGWAEMDVNDLIRSFYTYEDESMKSSCIAAIMVRYWKFLGKYAASSRASFDNDDFHEWLQHAVLYALKHRAWDDPTKEKLYGRPNGPDMAMKMCIASTRMIHYQSSNYQCHRTNYGLSSVEQLVEDHKEGKLGLHNNGRSSGADMVLKAMVKDAFDRGDYNRAFILDGIMNAEVFDTVNVRKVVEYSDDYTGPRVDRKLIKKATETEEAVYEYGYNYKDVKFNENKLYRHLRNFGSEQVDVFVENYDVNRKKVETTSKLIAKGKPAEVKAMISDEIKKSANEVREALQMC